MPNPNISAVLAPADKTTMKANVDANSAILDVFGVNLTPEQRRTLAKTGADSVSFVQDCLQVGQLHPTAVPGDMTIAEFEKDCEPVQRYE